MLLSLGEAIFLPTLKIINYYLLILFCQCVVVVQMLGEVVLVMKSGSFIDLKKTGKPGQQIGSSPNGVEGIKKERPWKVALVVIRIGWSNFNNVPLLLKQMAY